MIKKAYNVLFITHDSKMYGANQSLFNLINGLGENITPYVLLAEHGLFQDELIKRGIKHLVINYKQCGWWKKNGLPDSKVIVLLKQIRAYLINHFAVHKICNAFKDTKFDIIHSNTSVVDIGPLLSSKLKCKHVWHFREFQDLDHDFHLFVSKRKFISGAKKAGKVICITKSVATHFGMNSYAEIIFDGVRSSVPEIISNKQDYFIFCGAIKKQKGIEDALKALSIANNTGKNILLKIVGGIEHSYKDEFFGMIKKYDLEKRTEILGFRDDVDELIRNSKGLLMCSKNEAMGRVTVEAMLLGCPVIGYNNQGTAELIQHQHTGYLYSNVKELSEYMCYIAKNNDNSLDIISNAKKFATVNFLESVAANKVLKVYSLSKDTSN